MRIVILTSKNHAYANYLILSLLRTGILRTEDDILVQEQDWVIPRKSTLRGVLQYARSAGWSYVFTQAFKQYLFQLVRFHARLRGRRSSPFFPYDRWGHPRLRLLHLQDLQSSKTCAEIERFRPDLLLSLLSKERIPGQVLALPRLGCFNLHPALLPVYRGVSPTFWALANGEPEAGSTLHRIDNAFDTGAIIGQARVSLSSIFTEHQLYMACMDAGIVLLRQALERLRAGSPLPSERQTAEGSYYSLPTKKAVRAFHARGYAFFRVREFFAP